MGMFDEVIIKCKKCGHEYAEQSKAGDCILDIYTLGTAPDEILLDLYRQSVAGMLNCEACSEPIVLVKQVELKNFIVQR